MIDYTVIGWLALAVVLFLIESATAQLICVWFSIGSIMAMIMAALEAPFVLQLVVFLLASIAVLVFGRPLVTDWIATKKTPTNADRVIGQKGIVLEEINNLLQTGRVTMDGLLWTARCDNDQYIIPKDYPVRAVRIDGVKLIVEPLDINTEE